MIRLFDKDETNFDSNGLGVLDSEIKENVVEEKMNGIYNFDFAYLSKGKHANQLEGDMIIKVPTPDGDQLFRVYKVTKNIGFLEVNCYHIFYDLAGNFIEDINIVSQSGQAAITHFGTGLQYATRFKFVSNIVGTNSARMVRLNAVQALLDSSQDNSFLSRWGGEIKRDNFTVYMNDVRGNDKGFKIRHGKNLTGYEANIDYSSVATRIMPYGYDGLMLPEKYVDSPLRGKYAFTRIKKIEYTNIKAIDPDATSNDESAVPLEEAYKLLRQAAALEYSVNKVDIPTSNFKVTFKNLADTKEYTDFKALEKVEPWDYVTVIADNLDIKSRMISYKYDAITKAYKEVELGNYVPSFTDIGSKIDHATNLANQANDTANTAAESANGKNSNYHGPSEPSRPVDGDLWYKKNGDKTELWQYDGKSVPPGWKLVVDDATGEEVRQNVDAAQQEAEEAKKTANESVAAANDAVAKAGFANDTATQAKTEAAAAGQQAKDALTSAGTAITDAQNALTNSSSAQADSAQARKDSAAAKIQAANAATQANQAVTDASTAKADAAAAKGQATSALGQASTAISNAASALNMVNNIQVDGVNLLLNSDKQFTNSVGEFVATTFNLNDIFDKYGTDQVYTISYDLSSKDPSKVSWIQAYPYPGSTPQNKYSFPAVRHQGITTTPQRFSMTFKPTLVDKTITKTTLVFYGQYDSGNIPIINRIKVTLGNKGNIAWSPAPEDVQQQFTDINGELSQKVSQTTYNVLAGTVDTVNTLAKQNQSTISTLATKTSVDTVNKTATTAQTLAQQNANELLNKASTNTVDTLTQRVTTAESTLSQTATKAELALTKTDVDKLGDSVASQALDIAATADGLKLKADSSTVADLAGTVAQNSAQLGLTATKADLALTQNDVNDLDDTVNKQATQLALTATKAELQVAQTNVDNLKKTVTTNTAGMTANANALKLKADSSTVSDLDGRVTSLSGQLDVQSDLISAKVTASDVTGMLGNYATQSWSEGKISAAKNEISASVETVKNTVDAMSFSNRNLFRGYPTNNKMRVNKNNSYYYDYPFKSKGTRILLKPNTEYTVTWDYEVISGGMDNTENISVGRGNEQFDYAIDVVRFVAISDKKITIKTPSDVSDNPYFALRFSRTSVPETSVIDYWDIAVREGNINSGWTPAPEDQATVDWAKSQLDITDKKITAGITTVTNTLNNNIASATANMATTTWTNTQIDAAKTVINLSVEQSITTSENTLNSNIDNATKDMATQTWTKGQIKTTADSINLNVSKVQTDLSGTKTQFAALGVKVNGIQTTVSGKADQSQVTQLAGQITSVVGDVLANSSQITQMKADINLSVQKGDVVNQINISPEEILIDGKKVHITGLTKIDNAVIEDAMIADIKADKITAGTLNAANVNVINLNANNITTGTIKGANLSMNLNTGEVLFQKGSIKSTNGNLNIHIDDGSMSLTNSQGEGAYFIDGKIAMTKNDIWANGAIHYGQLTFGNNIFGNALGSVSGVQLEGAGGVIVGNKEFNPLTLFGPGKTAPSGGGFAANNSFATLSSKGWASIEGGTLYATAAFSTSNPSIVAGVSGKYSAPGAWMPTSDKGPASFVKGKMVGLYAEDGGFSMDHGTIADLAAAVDGRSGYILSAATYARTYASGAQMTITESGVFGRISSASKYKLAIGEISTLNDEAHQFLSVKPKQWFDKSESEALADIMTTGNTDYVDDAKALPHNGFIAEDLYTAGLDSYVIRSNDGSIESIQYDRLPVLHHELIRELFNRLDAAEMEIYKLKQEVLNNAN
ncbi:phage tail spike protein [Latilactobacillus curvatus]|uniref:phage tail spike protein n=1 Tax=Latilactobacillus curvatus TaxID=28038 RepID=UPI0039AE9ABE